MSIKYQIVTALVIAIIAFSFGRYSARTSTTSKEVAITNKDVQKDKNVHRQTVIVKEPSGKETTTITEDTATITTKTQVTKDKEQSTTVSGGSVTNISALFALDTSEKIKPLYGLSVSREVLGPVTIGAFGLTNGTIGVSVGVNF